MFLFDVKNDQNIVDLEILDFLTFQKHFFLVKFGKGGFYSKYLEKNANNNVEN
jgi:hypothetical protein